MRYNPYRKMFQPSPIYEDTIQNRIEDRVGLCFEEALQELQEEALDDMRNQLQTALERSSEALNTEGFSMVLHPGVPGTDGETHLLSPQQTYMACMRFLCATVGLTPKQIMEGLS